MNNVYLQGECLSVILNRYYKIAATKLLRELGYNEYCLPSGEVSFDHVQHDQARWQSAYVILLVLLQDKSNLPCMCD